MTDFPDVKFKAQVNFPARVDGGAGIDVTRSNGTYQFDLAYGDFAPPVTVLSDLSHQNSLLWNQLTGQYILVPVAVLSSVLTVPVEPILVTAATAVITAGTAAIVIQKTAPTTTGLTLPSVLAQNGVPLNIVDWSTSVVDHTITITPSGAEKIMLVSPWKIFSGPAQLGSVRLYPSVVLNGWYIAP